MTAQSPTAFATDQLNRLMGFFPRVEAKASFILALDIAMLGVLAANFPVRAFDSPRGCCGIIATLPMWFNLIRDEFWNIAVSIRTEFTGSVDGTGAALMQYPIPRTVRMRVWASSLPVLTSKRMQL